MTDNPWTGSPNIGDFDPHQEFSVFELPPEPSPCPKYDKINGCECRHCKGICLCHRERDEHGNEANGVCMNCGAAMVENRMHPWCNDCDEKEDDNGLS